MVSATTLLDTALTVIASYNAWSADAIIAPRAPNCTQQTFPSRLNAPTLNNTAYHAYITSIMPYMANFTVTPLPGTTTIDPHSASVAMQALGSADSVVGPYRNEYVVMMKMTADGSQVWEVREFIDSEVRAKFFPALSEYISGGGPTLEEIANGAGGRGSGDGEEGA